MRPEVADRHAGQALHDQAVRRYAGQRGLLRRHWLAALLLAAGLVLRLLAQFTYHPALFYIDSVKYLYTSDGNDPEGYKLPLRAILLVGNFNSVVAIQHLLGLVMAVVIYYCCCGAVRPAGSPPWPSRRSCSMPTSCRTSRRSCRAPGSRP